VSDRGLPGETKRTMNNLELLQAWATHHDEAAFAELVRRHLPLVHASARRQVRDLAVAQEVCQAVFLRFLEGKPIRAVGEHLGVGEEAAKKRVSRAVERIRTFLSRKGVVLSAGALMGLLTQVPGNATPAGLASQIVATVTTQTGSPLAATWAAGAVRD